MANMVFFEGTRVLKTKKGISYKVVLEEEEITIYLMTEKVNQMAGELCEAPELVAVLLAYMDYVRREASYRKLDDELVIKSTAKLLDTYPIEILIGYIKRMKWHQIEEVMNADDPAFILEYRV